MKKDKVKKLVETLQVFNNRENIRKYLNLRREYHKKRFENGVLPIRKFPSAKVGHVDEILYLGRNFQNFYNDAQSVSSDTKPLSGISTFE